MKLRDMSRELRWFILANIIANTSSRMLMPFIPLYLESLGANVTQIGLYFTMLIFFIMAFRVFGGWISDTVGRLPIVTVGSIFGACSTLAFAMATTWEFAFISALFSGIGVALVSPSYLAYIAEESPEGAVGSTFGLVESLFLICQIVGPLLGGFLVENTGYRIMIWVAFGIMVVATIMRFGISRHKTATFRDLSVSKLTTDMRKTVLFLLTGGLITWMFIADGLLDASNQAVMPFMPKYTTEVAGITEFGYGGLIAFLSVVGVMTYWLGGAFSDRYGNHISIAIGAVFTACAFSILAISTSIPSLLITFGIFGTAGAFIEPAFASLLSKAAPKDQLGVMYGFFHSALGLIAIPAPSIGGLFYERISPMATLVFGVFLSLISIPLVLLKLRPKDEQLDNL